MSAWEAWEREVSEILGVQRTITSGNKWFDPGDATTLGHSPWPLYVEAKYTEAQSYTLKFRDLQQTQQLADQSGKRLVMPIRIHPNWARLPAASLLVRPADYALIPLHDLAELLQKVRDDD